MLPCLDEAESLEHVIREIRTTYDATDYVYEIIVADNGSVDDSQQISSSNGEQVQSVKQRGYGTALRGGILSARGRYIVMGDADGSYLFADSVPMIERLRLGADLVIGDRFAVGGIAPGAMP